MRSNFNNHNNAAAGQCVRSRVKSRTNRCLLTAVAVLGLIPAASFATSPHGLPGPKAGNPNPGVPPNCISADQIGSQNPNVHPPCSKPYGLTYGEWSAKWWQWMQAIPLPENPNFEGTPGDSDPASVGDCAQGQSGQVWFLGGRFSPGPTTIRNCTLPTGKSIFFPISNIVFGDGWFDCNGKGPNFDPTLPTCSDSYWPNYPANPAVHSWTDLANWVASFYNPPPVMEVTVDGVTLTGLSAYRAQAPKFDYTLTSDNIFNAFGVVRAAGTYGPTGSDGFWIMLTPLSEGEHTLHFKTGDLFQDILYHLTVTPKK
jgi:hypothetical protein